MSSIKQAIYSLLVIPVQFILIYIFLEPDLILENPILAAAFYFSLGLAAWLAIIIINKDFLSLEWEKFKNKFWQKVFLSFIGAGAIHFILYLVRIPLNNIAAQPEIDVFVLPLSLGIMLRIMPLFAPFVEEVVFRYHLFYRFNSKALRFVMFFVSSALFGLLHYNNFAGNLVQLIPYMVIGGIFALIYLFVKNIWASIMVHFAFNLMNVAMGVIGLLAMKFMAVP